MDMLVGIVAFVGLLALHIWCAQGVLKDDYSRVKNLGYCLSYYFSIRVIVYIVGLITGVPL